MAKKFAGDSPSYSWRDSLNESFQSAPVKRCYETHPPLKLGKGTLYGGSCSFPVVKDAETYIGLDTSMRWTGRRFPWNSGNEFLYPIQDMNAPENAESFKALVTWICNQLQEGKTIHVGCIGGHGRTGTVFAAVVCQFLGEKDAIAWVRKNYCTKAVESKVQVDFLVSHFGIKSAEPAKGFDTKKEGKSKTADQKGQRQLPFEKKEEMPEVKTKSYMGQSRAIRPMETSKKRIW